MTLKLPALKSLGELAERQPIIVVDTREQTPLRFQRLEAVPGTLTTGDYSIAGLEHLFSVERKTVADLVGCCTGENRARFQRELLRLRGYQFKRLLVVGSEQDIREEKHFSGIKPQSVLATLYAFEIRFDLPIVFAPSTSAAACQIERWVCYFSREIVENANDLWRGTTPATTTPTGAQKLGPIARLLAAQREGSPMADL